MCTLTIFFRGSVELLSHQHPQFLLPRAGLNPFSIHPVFVLGIAPGLAHMEVPSGDLSDICDPQPGGSSLRAHPQLSCRSLQPRELSIQQALNSKIDSRRQNPQLWLLGLHWIYADLIQLRISTSGPSPAVLPQADGQLT